jgi:hypothetical protein
VFTPHAEGAERYYTFEGTGRLEALLRGLVPAGTGAVRQDWWPQGDSSGLPGLASVTITRILRAAA